MTTKKEENISCIKTIMMIIIVLCHSCAFFTGKWFDVVNVKNSAVYLGFFSEFLGTFHTQTFVMASGFLFYYLKNEKKKYANPRIDIKKRAKRLLIPYFVTSFCWAIPIGYYFFKYSFKEIIIKYFLMTSPSQLWFLIMLFIVFVLFELFSNKIKISLKNLIILLIVTTVTNKMLLHFDINLFQIANIIKYILYFYLGGFIYYNKNKISNRQFNIMIILVIILYFVIVFINTLNYNLLHIVSLMLKSLISIFEVSSIYYFCTKLVTLKKINMGSKLYKILEDNSFGVYLFHQQIIYFTIILFNGIVHPIIQVFLSFVISLGISLFISVILKKNKITKFLFGL